MRTIQIVDIFIYLHVFNFLFTYLFIYLFNNTDYIVNRLAMRNTKIVDTNDVKNL